MTRHYRLTKSSFKYPTGGDAPSGFNYTEKEGMRPTIFPSSLPLRPFSSFSSLSLSLSGPNQDSSYGLDAPREKEEGNNIGAVGEREKEKDRESSHNTCFHFSSLSRPRKKFSRDGGGGTKKPEIVRSLLVG